MALLVNNWRAIVAMPMLHDDAKVSTDVGALLGSIFSAIGAVAGVAALFLART